MYIEKLEIRGFGKVKDLTLNFTKGINIIFGCNESGKTTIQHFIKGMLFGLRGGRPLKGEGIVPLKRFKPWGSNYFGGAVQYCLDNGCRYRVERDFDSNTIKVFDSNYNDITNSFGVGKQKCVRFAEDHLSLNQACFERTVFIRQMESRISEDGSKELLNRLLNVRQTGFEDISLKKAQKALKDALISYVGTGRTSTRPLDKVNERLKELDYIKKSLITKRERIFSIGSKLEGAEAEKKYVERRKSALRKIKNLISLKKEIAAARNKVESLKEILNLVYVEEEKLKKAANRLKEISKNKDEMFALQGRQAKEGYDRRWRKVFNAAAILLVVLAVYFAVQGLIHPPLSVIAVLLPAAAAVATVFLKNKVAVGFKEKGLAAENLHMLNKAYEEKTGEVIELKDRLNDKYGQASAVAGEQFEDSIGIVQAINKIVGELGLIEGNFKMLLDELLIETMDTHLAFDTYKLDREMSLETLEELEILCDAQCRKTGEEHMEVSLRIKEYETLLRNMAGDDDEMQKVDEEIEELLIKKRHLEDVDTALRTALDVLTEAGGELERDYVPALNRRMSEIIRGISRGRYKDLRAGENLSLSVMEPETGQVVDSFVLSGGTVDQVYFALRLAMAELIGSQDERLPLIMDEVFAQYDDVRAEEAFKFLSEAYKDRQIIFFTCRGREVDAAKKTFKEGVNLISLEES